MRSPSPTPPGNHRPDRWHCAWPYLFFALLLPAHLTFTAPWAFAAETGSLPFQSINVPPEVGLRSLPEEDVHYRGALYNREAFLELWNLQENVMSDFPRLLNWLIPDPPPIDFNRHTVLWFSNRGAGASFVEMQRVVVSEDGGALEAHIKVVYSDFGSKKLNLWKIPKTHLPVVFREQAVFDGGP
ncbi:hypothetical protein [Nitrospina watsonii]|uniref:Uncharacterized protein n=1 Tax=Nitrospina watsonii TaxID=1323948 RepID=A0ABM9HG03_9BACT|nr:hypothetical protein [Nitrospina watsonii]CAI2719201.1 conserved protein of unknown function [Nitrospina watsonii]